jgi:hypothetical protein
MCPFTHQLFTGVEIQELVHRYEADCQSRIPALLLLAVRAKQVNLPKGASGYTSVK